MGASVMQTGRAWRWRAVLAGVATLVGFPLSASAIGWPQAIDAPEGRIVVYQPQPERLSGDVLTGRAAIALELKGKAEPVFGVFWFTARLDTDRDADTVLVRDVQVTQVRWPDSIGQSEAGFTQVVKNAVPKAGFEISLERLSASLATAQSERESLAELNNDPPKIVFTEELAVLLLYDGAPRFGAIEGSSSYERVLNTPLAVAREKSSGRVYLTSGAQWYTATDPLGPFVPTATPPADLKKMLPSDGATAPAASQPAPGPPPRIVVATAPTELIATAGKPNWKPLAGGKLLFVENTETPWLRDLSDQQMYVLLSGRWYRSKSQGGPWSFVRADQLPAAFRQIAPGSEVGGLRASVAGTEEAENAVRDAAIPQTAVIKRQEAQLTVQYDGAPKFVPIAGTSVAYAVNTAAQVLQIDARYYAVDNGVWFTAASPTGPWVVADKVPSEQIEKIPPSSPVYNTKYVYIYDSTPQVVYVGYTPGYLWSFPYYGVPVYGTGWYYPPYWGGIYYPRPPTWGFHVGYNPWTGWTFGVSWSNGFYRAGIAWSGGGGAYRPCCGGWYGGGYRPPVFINTGNINIGNSINIGNRTEARDRMKTSGGSKGPRPPQANLYGRPENQTRVADRTSGAKGIQPARPVANRRNDVLADKSGAVVRRSGNDWEVRNNGAWQADRPRGSQAQAQAPARTPAASARPSVDRADLNRSYQAREEGRAREMQRAAPTGGGGPRRR
jgi:hypothetical protein